MNGLTRTAAAGFVAAIVVGVSVGFLAFTFAPGVGTAFDFYIRAGAGVVVGVFGAGVVWFATVLTAQAKAMNEVGVDDEDDDPFFDR